MCISSHWCDRKSKENFEDDQNALYRKLSINSQTGWILKYFYCKVRQLKNEIYNLQSIRFCIKLWRYILQKKPRRHCFKLYLLWIRVNLIPWYRFYKLSPRQNIWVIWSKFNDILNSLIVNANSNILIKKNILKKIKALASLIYGAYATIKQKWYESHFIWWSDSFHIAVKKNN